MRFSVTYTTNMKFCLVPNVFKCDNRLQNYRLKGTILTIEWSLKNTL